LGYTFNSDIFRFGINGYYMHYDNQFVQTGQETEIGEKVTTNIKDSYRMGIELQAAVDPFSWLTIEGNAALSKNKIKDFDEVVEDWDNGSQTIHYDNSTLAFSPSAILNGFVNFHLKGWTATWHTGYVSRMYLDNTECKDRSLPGYSVSNFNVNYTLPVKKFLKEIVFGANLNNVFDSHFAQSGWVYSAIYASGGHPNDNRYYQIGYVPSAGFTAMGSITLKF
jgi:iron complex outermembrane receptor protein